MTAALASVEAGQAGELIAMDLRAAIDALGEITGAVSTDDILDRIFKEFCIGK
jgi:tRNA modification GTPase